MEFVGSKRGREKNVHFFGMRKNMMLTSVNLRAKLVCFFIFNIRWMRMGFLCELFVRKKEGKK